MKTALAISISMALIFYGTGEHAKRQLRESQAEVLQLQMELEALKNPVIPIPGEGK